MTTPRPTRMAILTLALSGALLATPALAERPAHAGSGKPDRPQAGAAERGPAARAEPRDDDRRNDTGRPEQRERRNDSDRREARNEDRGRDRDGDSRRDRDGDYRNGDSRDSRDRAPRTSSYFTERHREVVRSYYGERYRSGDCPPGLAKKRNGCMPPGLAKQWRVGSRLPRDVIYYDAPGDIVLRLGMPPEGHRYVRVAADILLIAVGTGMVVDAIEDLNRM